MNVLALCAGYGGLELALRRVCPESTAVCYVEREAYAAACLVARMEGGSLAPAPIWDDVATFDGHPWRGKVDCVTAGFPCQPFSVAGKRLGTSDGRWLWPQVARVIAESRPGLVVLENTPGLRQAGLRVVLADLARLGFDAEWGLYRADWVGSPHRRQRLFVLAYADGGGQQGIGLCAPWDGVRATHRDDPHGCGDWQGWPPGRSDPRWAGLPARTQPGVRRSPDGPAPWLERRVDRLRLLGNGVVPHQAAEAIRQLARRGIGGTDETQL